MDQKKSSNKISDIVRLQRILKKWKKLAANGSKDNVSINTTTTPIASSCKNFLKRTLSFTETISPSPTTDGVPKGFVAVDCVGKEDRKRFIIPTDHLGHQVFGILLKEAEDEFGFQQEGVLQIPCEVGVFEKILKVVEDKNITPSSPSSDLMLLHRNQIVIS